MIQFSASIHRVLSAVTCAALSLSPALAADNPAESAVNWTPVVMQTTVTPQAFQGSDNRWNLVYELLLTNYNTTPAVVGELHVLDKDTGKEVLNLTGKDLVNVMVPVGHPVSNKINPGANSIIYVNVAFDKAEDVPKHLEHKIVYDARSVQKQMQRFTVSGAPVTVNEQPPIVIAPPLRGGKWCAFGGYSGLLGHRRTLFPIDNRLTSAQRYAIDWTRLDDQNYSTKGSKTDVHSSPAYEESVYAVADGTIYGVVDKFDNQVPFKPTGDDRFRYPAGNCIVLDMGDGRYGMYAHLRRGSILVKPGDKVKKGDVIAKLGNSGNSTGPHLHFHVVDDPHILGSNGVPYVFDNFKVVGEVDDLKKFILNDAAAKPQTIATSKVAGDHQKQLPKEGHIVQF